MTMRTDTPGQEDADASDVGTGGTGGTEEATVEALREQVEALQERVADLESVSAADGKSMVVIATKGTLDMAYPPLILASTAAAFDWDVTVFYTFWGLDVLHEERSAKLKLSAVGNPNVPMPNAVAALPGMDGLATRMMRKRIADNGTASIGELVEISLEQGVDLQACQMTMDLMDYDDDDFFEGVTTGVGAATALGRMGDADVQLMI